MGLIKGRIHDGTGIGAHRGREKTERARGTEKRKRCKAGTGATDPLEN